MEELDPVGTVAFAAAQEVIAEIVSRVPLPITVGDPYRSARAHTAFIVPIVAFDGQPDKRAMVSFDYLSDRAEYGLLGIDDDRELLAAEFRKKARDTAWCLLRVLVVNRSITGAQYWEAIGL